MPVDSRIILGNPKVAITYQCNIGAEALVTYRLQNRQFLQPWEPIRPAGYYALDDVSQQMSDGLFDPGAENAHRLAILCASSRSLVGLINFTALAPYPFMACHLGFSMSAAHQGKGLMQSALELTLPYAFSHWGLNRVMANFMPRNSRSARLLQAAGFQVEGFAKRYLQINGEWEDHILTSRLASPE